MAAGSSHIAGFFFILGSLEERMQKLQSLQAARHEFFLVFSQRFFCWKPGWRNWSDFSLNHHIFLGTVVWCCYPWDASPWFHKVCCPESVPFSGFGVFNGIHIPPTNGERRVQSKICAGLRCAKVSQDTGGLVGNFYQTLWLWVYDALCIKRLTMASQQVLLLFFDRKRYRLISLACCRHGLFPLPHDLHRRGRGTSSAGHPSKELSANADSLLLSCGKTKNTPSPLLQGCCVWCLPET